ncbi:MAG: FKBP-type peptidyl-prolyl cis-trans isomerase [Candidatus Azotimanducaceae bacterium]|jgi:FKBP-type peptidyl-prolyl cis-trans isomerase
MFNKFEALGIAVSIGAMVLALWFIRIDSTTNSLANVSSDTQSAAIYVADGDNQNAAIADAVIESSNGTGDLTKIIIDDVTLGEGREVVLGDTVLVHYIGTLQNGQQFDNSYVKGTAFEFEVGEGRVIAGWEQGIVGMKKSGQRILVIPPHLGYGESGFGPIPANATLVFAIELLGIDEK